MLLGVVAHEVAHAPDGEGNGDHISGGLMTGDGVAKIEMDFLGASINRIRSAIKWE